ncbi:MAG TPA: PepSY domain-containing protein [Candidatus Sulfotelmatobacter sp.]|nr:PepSY domain-containing protein [Candidatus Sulfotelmatobacter sp.]
MKSKAILVALGAGLLTAGTALAAEPALKLDRAEAAALHSAPISLAKAIAIAARQGHGKVMNIVSRPGGPDDLYVVTLVADGHIRTATVDAVSGRFVPSHTSLAVRQVSRGERADVTALDAAARPLSAAVAIAVGYTHGKAGDAGLETLRGGKVAYEVNVLKDGAFYDVWVDPTSGHVIETATS